MRETSGTSGEIYFKKGKPVGNTMKTEIVQFFMTLMEDGKMYGNCGVIKIPSDIEHVGTIWYNYLWYSRGRKNGRGFYAIYTFHKNQTRNRWCDVRNGTRTHSPLPANTRSQN